MCAPLPASLGWEIVQVFPNMNHFIQPIPHRRSHFLLLPTCSQYISGRSLTHAILRFSSTRHYTCALMHITYAPLTQCELPLRNASPIVILYPTCHCTTRSLHHICPWSRVWKARESSLALLMWFNLRESVPRTKAVACWLWNPRALQIVRII
jgi:hypothetical protein